MNQINRLNRRQFAAGATAIMASLGSNRQPTIAAEEGSRGWIDAHVHVWTPDTTKYPLDASYKISDMKPTSFTPEQLFAHSKPSGVDRIVLIQMSFYRFDNRYMTDMIQAHPGVFSGVGIVDHHAEDLEQKMLQLSKQGVRGFRISAKGKDTKPWLSDEGMARLWAIAGKNNLAVCPLINPTDLATVNELAKRNPETTVVVDHFGRVGVNGQFPSESLDALCGLAKHRKTHVKASAFYALGKRQAPHADVVPMIRAVVDAFGPDRVMWATDCPYQVGGKHTYAESIKVIKDHCDFLGESDKEMILRGTAERVFFG